MSKWVRKLTGSECVNMQETPVYWPWSSSVTGLYLLDKCIMEVHSQLVVLQININTFEMQYRSHLRIKLYISAVSSIPKKANMWLSAMYAMIRAVKNEETISISSKFTCLSTSWAIIGSSEKERQQPDHLIFYDIHVSASKQKTCVLPLFYSFSIV